MTLKILDACCGSRMAWYDKNNPLAVFMDNRQVDETLCDGRRLVVSPDVVGDFRNMPFPDQCIIICCFVYEALPKLIPGIGSQVVFAVIVFAALALAAIAYCVGDFDN